MRKNEIKLHEIKLNQISNIDDNICTPFISNKHTSKINSLSIINNGEFGKQNMFKVKMTKSETPANQKNNFIFHAT